MLAALNARQRKMQMVLVASGGHDEKLTDVLLAAEAQNIPIKRLPWAELDAMAHGTSHGGVLAICSAKPRTTEGQLLELLSKLREPPLLLLLEGVDDERNLGFSLRSAEAMGVHAVLIKKHLWDFDETDVARPASGAYERLPLVQIDDLDLLIKLQRRGLKLYGCLAGVKHSMYDTNLAAPCILCIGGEKRGISGAVRSICDQFVSIPSRPEPSSLSLSHASAILIAEAMRQRLLSAKSSLGIEPAPTTD